MTGAASLERGGTGTLSINGKKVGSGRLARTIPFIYGVETADVGMDLYSAVTTAYATGENQFSGNDQAGGHQREVRCGEAGRRSDSSHT